MCRNVHFSTHFFQYPGSIPDDLQQINLSVLDLQTCAERLQGANPITTGNVCTTSPINQGACQGDSGKLTKCEKGKCEIPWKHRVF